MPFLRCVKTDAFIISRQYIGSDEATWATPGASEAVIMQGDNKNVLMFINNFASDYTPKLRLEDRKLISRHAQINAQGRSGGARKSAVTERRDFWGICLQSDLHAGYHSTLDFADPQVQSTNVEYSKNKTESRHKRLDAQRERTDQARQANPVNSATIWRNFKLCHVDLAANKLTLGFESVLPPVLTSKVGTVSDAFSFFVQGLIEKLFPVSKVAEQHAQWVISHALSSSALVSALVSVGAASLLSLKNSRSQVTGSQISPLDLILFNNVTLKCLNSAIDDVDARPEILVYSIMCIMVAEMIAGNGSAMCAHSAALHKAMHLKLDMENLPPHVMETFLSCYMSNIIQGSPPIYPPIQLIKNQLTSSNYKISDRLKSDLLGLQMGGSFCDPDVVAYIRPDLLSLFHDLRLYLLWREHHRCKMTDPDQDEISYFHCLHWYCHYMALHPLHDHEQDAMRIGLLISRSTNNQVIKSSSLLYRALTKQLMHALQSCDIELWSRKQDNVRFILIWLLLLGAYISQNQLEYHWFLMTIRFVIQEHIDPHLITWTIVEERLSGYLYMNRIYGQQFRAIWIRAVQE